MNPFLKYGSFLLLIGLIIAIAMQHGDEDFDGMTAFVYYLGAGLVAGFIFISMILPRLGDAVGEAVLSSGEEVEEDPYHKVHTLVNQGDYDEAVTVLREIARDSPNDRRPVAEVVKIYLEKLKQPEGAIQILEQSERQSGWEEDDRSFFLSRLADLYLEHRDDDDSAKKVLQQIIDEFPETRHSANAIHKLRELDPALVAELLGGPPPGTTAPAGGSLPSNVPAPSVPPPATRTEPPKPSGT